jgi:hypothetical protein
VVADVGIAGLADEVGNLADTSERATVDLLLEVVDEHAGVFPIDGLSCLYIENQSVSNFFTLSQCLFDMFRDIATVDVLPYMG